MPVIVNAADPHPFLPSLGDAAAIEAEQARHQDIRPIEIAIINLMADKRATERQLALWLGNTMLQVNLTFVATDDYMRQVGEGRSPKNTPADHIKKYYSAWSDIKHRMFDGVIVTGVNALKPTVGEETFWPEVQKILDWCDSHAFSSLFLCWGAKAALKHFHNIESHKAAQKTFGLFAHILKSDKTGLLSGFPDVFPVPVSRWKSPDRADIEKCTKLEIVADSIESGPNILVEDGILDASAAYPKRVYILNHPEYDVDTLKQEHDRDHALNPAAPLPLHYFPDDNPELMPVNTWRHTAHIYTNWIKALYEAVPFELAAPKPILLDKIA